MTFLREPLVHFLALGVGLYVLFSLVDDSNGDRQGHIVVSANQIERLAERWTRVWQRPPPRLRSWMG